MEKRILLPLLEAHDGLSCSLDPGELELRLEDWRNITASTTKTAPIEGGRRFHFPREADVVAIARLAAAEQTCCSFFEFAIGVTADAITLDITGPEEAQDLITSFDHSE